MSDPHASSAADRSYHEAERATKALWSDWMYKCLTRDEDQAARARDALLAAIAAQHDAARALVRASGLPTPYSTPSTRPASRDEQRPNHARRAEGRPR